MRKIILFLTIFVMICTLCACSSTESAAVYTYAHRATMASIENNGGSVDGLIIKNDSDGKGSFYLLEEDAETNISEGYVDARVSNEETNNAMIDDKTIQEDFVSYWTPTKIFKFCVYGKPYYLGETCETILNDFDVIEMRGEVNNNNIVPSCENASIVLRGNESDKFTVVVVNDTNQPINISECIIHAVLVNSKAFKLDGFTIDDKSANCELSDIIEIYGDDYSQYDADEYVYNNWGINEQTTLSVSTIKDSEEIKEIQITSY